MNRYRMFLRRRREDRELRARLTRVLASGLVPVVDEPLELPTERVDVANGRLLDRRQRKRG